MHKNSIVLSCEHASNSIPTQYRELFTDAQEILKTHQGWDIGAPDVIAALGKRLDVKPHYGQYSRLLVDLNRSSHHSQLFSRYTKPLPQQQRDEINRLYYRPYRDGVHQDMIDISKEELAVHLSIHSFTPQFNGVVRQCHVGLLYDPSRPHESEFSKALQKDLGELLPGLRVRRNYPYTGIQDGIIPKLRKEFTAQQYFGLEIEFNQALFVQDQVIQSDWMSIFVECLASRAETLIKTRGNS